MKSDDCQTCYCSRGKVLCKGEPCTSVTVSSVTVPLDEPQKCVNGWTAWINQDPAIKGKKFKDVEPLPSSLELVEYFIISSIRIFILFCQFCITFILFNRHTLRGMVYVTRSKWSI